MKQSLLYCQCLLNSLIYIFHIVIQLFLLHEVSFLTLFYELDLFEMKINIKKYKKEYWFFGNIEN